MKKINYVIDIIYALFGVCLLFATRYMCLMEFDKVIEIILLIVAVIISMLYFYLNYRYKQRIGINWACLILAFSLNLMFFIFAFIILIIIPYVEIDGFYNCICMVFTSILYFKIFYNLSQMIKLKTSRNSNLKTKRNNIYKLFIYIPAFVSVLLVIISIVAFIYPELNFINFYYEKIIKTII